LFAYRYQWFVLFSCMLLSGCGEAASEDISGKVTFKGVPVTVGRVTFFSPKGTAGILLGEDGIFTLPIPLEPGEYKVMITPVVEHDSAGDSKQGENFVEMAKASRCATENGPKRPCV